MTVLAAREGYNLWAARYEAETATSALEDEVVRAMSIDTTGRSLLDVGCGVGRRLDASATPVPVGVDLTPTMLAHAAPGLRLAAADVRALPFARGSFEVVWCRLVIGHVSDLSRAYAELARVCRAGGDVVVTDFHPAAVAAGHRRTFRDAAGTVREIEHHVHRPEDHTRAATEVGLELRALRVGAVGPSIRPFYERSGRLTVYDQQQGLPLVLAFSWRRVQ